MDDFLFGVGDFRIGGGDGIGDMKLVIGREGGGIGFFWNVGGGGRDFLVGGMNNVNLVLVKLELLLKIRIGLGR